MPCYRCGARQTDPARGPSPWKRGVIHDEQVLVCPDCQQAHAWTDELDRCGGCGSTMLVRVLGETRCKACDWSRQTLSTSPSPRAAGLSEDVAAALERVLRRGGAT